MNIATLLTELRPLLAEPEANFDKLRTMLDRSKQYAEYEVLRHVATPHLTPLVERWMRSENPRDRRRALDLTALVFTRSAASRVARRWVKDADGGVRSRAAAVASALGGREVSLPNTRVPPQQNWRTREPIPPPWSSAGWFFGLAAGQMRLRVKRVAPAAITEANAALPALRTADDVARLVGLEPGKPLKALLRPGVGPGAPYVRFEIPKADGGSRAITAPRAALKRAQRALLRELFAKLPTHDAAHGFVKGRSVVTNAAPHRGAALVLKLDLEDFFPTIHYRRVAGLLRYHGVGPEAAGVIAALCTYRGRLDDGKVLWPGVLPQGAPTSPAIANVVCRRLDARLRGLAARCGGTYTRYADDLTFSFASEGGLDVGRFFWWVDQVCQQEGFGQNAKKRRVLRRANQQRVTGVVVNTELHVPRDARRRFRAIVHNCRRNGVDAEARGRKDFRAYLLGFAAYVKMVQPEEGAKLLDEVRALVRGDGETPKPAGS